MTEVTAQRPQGAPCWVSLLVRSLPLAQEFYGSLFGWEFQRGPMHFGPYARATLDGRLVAGIGESLNGLRQPIAWTTYLSTADTDEAAETIRVCGGTVAVGPLAADLEAGRMAIAADPSGASFGVWQAIGHSGVGVIGAPGALTWNELETRDARAVAKFYSAAFGFETDLMTTRPGDDGTDYVTLCLEGRPVAGVRGTGGAPLRGHGARWLTYFEVEDTDAAARRVTESGGRVLAAPYETARGRVAQVADPEGAVFMLVRTAR